VAVLSLSTGIQPGINFYFSLWKSKEAQIKIAAVVVVVPFFLDVLKSA